MADANDAGGGARGASPARIRVNGRRISFDLTTGLIIKAPPALRGKYICHEQMADILEAGDYVGRLCTVDRPEDIRLAEAEYAFLKPKERDMKTEVIKGITVEYGHHGLFRVIGMDEHVSDAVVLEAGDGKRIAIPLHRYQNETTVSSTPVERAPEVPRKADPYEQVAAKSPVIEGSGSVHIDEADIDKALTDRINALFESDDFVSQLAEAVARKLATTLSSEGHMSPGDAIASSSDDNGEITA